MARARLHLICGNCGCNDEWVFRYVAEEILDGELMQGEDVFLTCNNCGTLHVLSDNMKGEE